jgi:hypothetical protein
MMMEDRAAARDERQANLAALQQIFQLAAGNRNNNNDEDQEDNGNEARHSKLRDFQNTNPPMFSRCKEPLDAGDWLRTIENDLQVANVGDNENVLYATHYLAGQARAWWISIQDIKPEGQVMTWNEFKERFRKRQVPAGLIKLMRDMFRNLNKVA